ncbi:PAS domain S-box protein [Pedobacter sp. HMF7647]|uniref:Sensor protein FixL n=1 Tax=Hufsiella arboris TaxID=2695275 RepID=A0A7K1YD18_9SPHI|nr:PAS domain-containing sensor histidine kinase [Hufsiella arboris]MXV52473.1 PAS domain S-box protein [Hufsiella arboris]
MESAKLLNAIIETAIDGIITINSRGLVESVNPAALALFGYHESEVIGRNISVLMPEPEKSSHDQYIANYQHTGVKKIIGVGREVRGLRKDGSTFPFRLAVSEVKSGENVLYTGFIHDLSKEKEAEERLKNYAAKLEHLVDERTASLKQSVEDLRKAKEEVSQSLEKEKELYQLKAQFVSTASHEFRTPLGSVQLSASLIEKYAENCNPNIARHIGKIKNAVTSLTNILNDFLSIDRIDAGKVQVNYSIFNLPQLALEITEEMRLSVKQDQQVVYGHIGEVTAVRLDSSLLKNCIINLLSNAIKYSDEGTTIQFVTEVAGETCIIKVKDAGIGIPREEQKHLFEPFFRASNTGSIPGTGLGLDIVQRYTELLNGTIQFESVQNEGTLFTLTFAHATAKNPDN